MFLFGSLMVEALRGWGRERGAWGSWTPADSFGIHVGFMVSKRAT